MCLGTTPRRTAPSLCFFAQLRDRLAEKLETLRQTERSWAAADPRYPDQLSLTDFHVQLTLRSGLLSLASKVQWCTESIRRVFGGRRLFPTISGSPDYAVFWVLPSILGVPAIFLTVAYYGRKFRGNDQSTVSRIPEAKPAV